jgi:hypothetical protein
MTNKINNNGRLKKIYYLAVFAFVMLCCIIISVFIILVYPFNPGKFGDVILEKETVRAGGVLTYTVNFNKYTTKMGEITRFLINKNGGKMVITPYAIADASPSDTSKKISIGIPDSTPPGDYEILFVVKYHYFGIREAIVSGKTPIFKVIW